MLDELDEMLGSPEELQRRLDALDAKLARMARSYEELDRATESLRVTETDPSGAVRVTVDSQGRLIDVVTTPQVARLPAEQVGPLVLACVQRAQSRIAGQIAALARNTVGEDEMATHVVETMRARFPEPAPATPVRAAGHMDIGERPTTSTERRRTPARNVRTSYWNASDPTDNPSTWPPPTT